MAASLAGLRGGAFLADRGGERGRDEEEGGDTGGTGAAGGCCCCCSNRKEEEEGEEAALGGGGDRAGGGGASAVEAEEDGEERKERKERLVSDGRRSVEPPLTLGLRCARGPKTPATMPPPLDTALPLLVLVAGAGERAECGCTGRGGQGRGSVETGAPGAEYDR